MNGKSVRLIGYVLLTVNVVLASVGFRSTVVAQEQVVIRALLNPSTYTDQYLNWLDDVWFPAFEAEHPNITVNITRLAGSRPDAVAVAVAGGVPYDIVDAPHTPTFTESVGEGWYLPLDPYLAEWDGTEQIIPGVWTHTRWEGTTYAIPNRVAPRTIAYNKAMFSEAGLDPESPPLSWEELIEASRRLVRIQGEDLVRRGFHMRESAGDMAATFELFISNNGGHILSEDVRTMRFHELPGLQTLNFMREIYQTNNPAGFSRDLYPSPNRGFTTQQAAIVPIAGTGLITTVAQDFADVIEMGNFVPQRSPSDEPVMTASINSVAILRFTEHPDEAWLVLEHLLDEESLETFALYRGQPIPRRDMAPFFYSNTPELTQVIALMDYLAPRPKWPRGGGYTYTSAFGDPMLTAVHGEITPEVAMEEAQRRVRIMLDDFWESVDSRRQN